METIFSNQQNAMLDTTHYILQVALCLQVNDMVDDKVIPVKVALRCRPLVPKEVSEGCDQCLQFIKGAQQVILGNNKAFTYDFVFSPASPQSDVYDNSVKQLVNGIFKGTHLVTTSFDKFVFLLYMMRVTVVYKALLQY